MQRIKRKCIVWGVVLLILFCSCSAANSPIQDGYYSAEAKNFDADGWKDYVTICVSSGKIILVEFNAFNSSGFMKSWDMNYMREMNAANGTYPYAYTRYYGKKLLDTQKPEKVDVVAGATISYNKFVKLADAALENARQGKSETYLVDMSGNPDWKQ